MSMSSDGKRLRPRLKAVFVGPTRTRQSAKQDCDINEIMRRSQQAGFVPGNPAQARYGDFSGIPDYQESLNIVLAAERAFHGLPAVVRRRFGNDPGQMLVFLKDPANKAEAVKLGLVVDKEPVSAPGKPLAPAGGSAPASVADKAS